MSDVKTPKEVEKVLTPSESDKKLAEATQKLLEDIKNRQTTDSNNE